MKTVYAIRVLGDIKWVDEILLLNKNPEDRLDEKTLEQIFEAHNSSKKASFSLTGWYKFMEFRDYVVDIDNLEVYRCEPIGWKKIR